MEISEVMHKGVSTVQINDSIKRVAALMKREDIGAVPVYKNERPVGFVTDRDIVISCVAEGKSAEDPISLAMSREIVYVRENEDLSVAAKLMEDNQISRLLVVDASGGTPVGIISLHDIAEQEVNPELKSQILSRIKH